MTNTMVLAVAILVGAAAVGPGGALAKNQGKLPADAKPMPSADLNKLIAGRSVDYKIAAYYFNPNGQVIAVAGKNDGIAEGTWTIKDNEFCFVTDWKGADKSKPPFHYEKCQKFYLSKTVVYTENTKVEDQWLEDIFQFNQGDGKKYKTGDLLSTRFGTLKAKFGY